ncbi:MAG: recombinase family protein [Bacteroidales bacterium]
MIAIYFRLKSNNEVNDKALKILVENANSFGGNYRIFSEITDTKQNQPLKENLLERIHNNEFDIIVLFRLCDWSASMTRMSYELAELSANGIRIISHSENIDSFTPTGKLYLQMLGAFSEFGQTPGSESTGNDVIRNCIPGKLFRKDMIVERNNNRENTGNHYKKVLKNDFIPIDLQKELNDKITDSSIETGKTLTARNSFDLIGLSDACLLTGYSKNTIFQMTSKKLIPFFKRPGGRRIFFSKRALEQWIMTGKK